MSLITSKFFREGQPARKLFDQIQAETPEVCATGVKGSAPAFFLSLLYDMLERHVVVVAPTREEARELYEELLFFRNEGSAVPDDLYRDVLLFPPLETQPYENVLSYCDISAQRLWTLYRLCESSKPCLVVSSVRAVMQKTLPAETLVDSCSVVAQGDELDREQLCETLVACGYSRVSMVEDKGDLSIRGDVMDVFPPGYGRPVRIDFFGDVVESIKLFDAASQRSCAELKDVTLVPVREVLLHRDSIDGFQERIRQDDCAELFALSKGKAFAEGIVNGFLPSGVEYGMSYLYPKLETIFEYMPDNAVAAWVGREAIEEQIDSFASDVAKHYTAACEERRVVSVPEDIFVAADTIVDMPGTMQRVVFEGWDVDRDEAERIAFAVQGNDDIRSEMRAASTQTGGLAGLAERIEQWFSDGMQVCLACHTKSQCERLGELLLDYGVESDISPDRSLPDLLNSVHTNRVDIFIGKLARGFRSKEGMLALVTEEELFGEKKRRIVAPRFKGGTAISDFSDLREGDLIVHRENGIGMYRGLDTLKAGGLRADYLSLEYLGGDKLYLPVSQINVVAKYERADDTEPRLDKLGGSSWKRVTKKVRESIEKIARDLVELYSARKVHEGYAFAPPDHYYREFEAAFPYEETPDQLAAIQDVMSDMSNPMPMDRLICGDVGYGKTEIALRAAFRAAMEGKQVAVFVPTTVLAQQHYQTFSERLAAYPIRVDIVSRFRSPKDQKQIVLDLAEGKIDIIIGTHRLISKDVVFKDLGMVIIDEEHRFGVKHKEKLKKIRATVDVLTLTATPIPRTLQLSLFGVRDFSLIETPPEDRLAIRTVITHFDDTVIRDAVLRELQRGGQVFFVHDRVRSIPSMAQYLRRLVPEMRLGVAHGQMKEHELERSMMQFVRKEVDVLLCTTIIESGLDFPTANTIIMNSAHRLGLAQMYQLRGRVGRGKIRAYAYLLVPGKSVMNRDSVKRLEAIAEFSELGSGYRLATRDLQIRGAGNILGHSQSGHIASVGIDMYLELLNDAITSLRGEKKVPVIDPEINLNVQAFIPEDYVEDTNQRLVLYRRIASVQTDDEIADIEEELRDRFGTVPEQVATLLETARLRNVLRHNMVLSVDSVDGNIVFSFHEEAAGALDKLLALVSRDQKRYRLTPDSRFYAAYTGPGGDDILRETALILK